VEVPTLRFARAEHRAFFYEDVHLLLIEFERDRRRLLFLIHEAGEPIELEFPGDLFEERVRDAVDRVFFAELQEEGGPPISLALGALFPVEGTWYGAYYERGKDERTLYFLRIAGEGEAAILEAVEDSAEHGRVETAFRSRYADMFGDL
jgi:hypothetical protein